MRCVHKLLSRSQQQVLYIMKLLPGSANCQAQSR